MLVTAAALLVVAGTTGLAGAGEIEWRRDYATAYYEAGRQAKPMLIHVSASWCAPCHRMLDETYTDARVSAALGGPFVPLMLDADADAAWLQRLGVESVPTVLIVNVERRVIHRLSGFQTAGELDVAMSAAAPAAKPSEVAADSAAGAHTVGMTMFQGRRAAP